MSAITILLVAIVALLAGMEGILDEFQFHQPLVACTLIGLVTAIAHAMDSCAEKGDFAGIERWQYAAILMQGLRIAIPAVLLCIIPAEAVTNALNAMPDWLSGGMAVGGGMVASVGYAMVINVMATKETWPFFILGFVLAAIPQLTLIALGLIGISLALIYLGLKDLAKQGGGMGGGSGDPLGDILNDYE